MESLSNDSVENSTSKCGEPINDLVTCFILYRWYKAPGNEETTSKELLDKILCFVYITIKPRFHLLKGRKCSRFLEDTFKKIVSYNSRTISVKICNFRKLSKLLFQKYQNHGHKRKMQDK